MELYDIILSFNIMRYITFPIIYNDTWIFDKMYT